MDEPWHTTLVCKYVLVLFKEKKSRWAKCQTPGFKTVVHKPVGVVSVDHLSKVRYPRLSTAKNLKQPEQGCVSTAIFPLAAFISSTNPALTFSWKQFKLVFNIAMLINAISYQLIQIKERQDVW